MKRFLLIAFAALVTLSCVSAPKSSSMDSDDVFELWAKSIEGKDLDALMTTYWPDAVVINLTPDEEGIQQKWTGSDEITEMQRGSTGNPDFKMVVRLDTSRREMMGDTAVYTVNVEAGTFVVTNTLKLEKRGSGWRIVNQTVEFESDS